MSTKPKSPAGGNRSIQEIMAEAQAAGGGAALEQLQAPAPEQPPPWLNAHPKLKVNFTLRLPEAVHLQLGFMASKLPGTSMHDYALAALREKLERDLERLGLK